MAMSPLNGEGSPTEALKRCRSPEIEDSQNAGIILSLRKHHASSSSSCSPPSISSNATTHTIITPTTQVLAVIEGHLIDDVEEVDGEVRLTTFQHCSQFAASECY